MEQKTVFISYRRDKSRHLARSIYMDLKMNGWDVFLDVDSINAGDFDRIILNQIAARAHFILLISPGSLERCANEGDWVLREIEEAVRLERNIVPIFEVGTNFATDFSQEMNYLPHNVRAVVSKKNAIPLLDFNFDDTMEKLRSRFLRTPQYVQTQETPAEDRTEVQRRIAAAEVEESAPAPIQPAQLVEEQATFTVVLKEIGPLKINVIKIVRNFTGLDLRDTKELVESAPSTILRSVSKEVAEGIKAQLEASDAEVEII